ncbi:MAG: hypothetical protein AB7V13_19420 [Pseudorhodoplanes sp.]|jgi:hypothetical protein|uniref:hypothetical protein n=1 Tax=Pseudorhodoplanes sp. TaxID=1934341 RepID=UPI003D0AE955
MLTEQEIRTIREAVGIFHRNEDLQSAIDELLSSGFHRSELGLLASETAVREKLGAQFKSISALADDPAVPRAAYVSPEAIGDAQGGLIGALVYVGAAAAAGAVVASGGTLAAIITAVVLAGGTGGLLGSALAKWLGDRHATYLQDQIDRGGLLLWVRTRGTTDEQRAIDILKRHSGGEVHVHAPPMQVANPTGSDNQVSATSP